VSFGPVELLSPGLDDFDLISTTDSFINTP
jgi:hypothetical protein